MSSGILNLLKSANLIANFWIAIRKHPQNWEYELPTTLAISEELIPV